MGKRFKTNKFYTTLQNLEKVWKLKNDDSPLARMKLDFYVRNGYMPAQMKRDAKDLIDNNWDLIKPKRILKRHHLYAITDGEFIKVGMSSDVDKRLRNLQTASPRQLRKLWVCYAGEDDKEARKYEKKLHRAIKRYAVSGEWFRPECMSIVEGWRVRSLNAKQEEEAEQINDELDAEFTSIMQNL